MAQIVDRDIRKVIEDYGTFCIQKMQIPLAKTEKLKNDIKRKVVLKNGQYELLFIYPEYSIFVHAGRRPSSNPSHWPPKDPIIKWMNNKGINEKYLWPIIKHIGKEGIKARPFMNIPEKNMKVLIDKLGPATAEDVAINIRNSLKGKKNLTVS